jgi:hypothetical protein
MRKSYRALVALTTVSALLAFPAGGHAAPRHRIKLPRDYAAWTRVADCESAGKWQVLGTAYPDPVGITPANWALVHGKPIPPGPVPLAERVVVIRVADRLIAWLRTHGHPGYPIPDRYGCASW